MQIFRNIDSPHFFVLACSYLFESRRIRKYALHVVQKAAVRENKYSELIWDGAQKTSLTRGESRIIMERS